LARAAILFIMTPPISVVVVPMTVPELKIDAAVGSNMNIESAMLFLFAVPMSRVGSILRKAQHRVRRAVSLRRSALVGCS
jgi:hypothetical protein